MESENKCSVVYLCDDPRKRNDDKICIHASYDDTGFCNYANQYTSLGVECTCENAQEAALKGR